MFLQTQLPCRTNTQCPDSLWSPHLSPLPQVLLHLVSNLLSFCLSLQMTGTAGEHLYREGTICSRQGSQHQACPSPFELSSDHQTHSSSVSAAHQVTLFLCSYKAPRTSASSALLLNPDPNHLPGHLVKTFHDLFYFYSRPSLQKRQKDL